MLIMGIDTSSDIGAIGLVDENGLLAEMNICLQHRHSERLLPNIDYIFKETGYKISELDGLSISIGPGSFTGLRIGLSTVKSFAQVLDIPIIGLSTLDILAYNLYQQDGWIVPVIDAKRERVYNSLYFNWSEDIKSNKRWPDQVLTVRELLKRLSELDRKGTFYLVGNGAVSYRNIFEDSPLKFVYPKALLNIPKGGIVAEMGRYYLNNGVKDDFFTLLPHYLKKTQAEINWHKKNTLGE